MENQNPTLKDFFANHRGKLSDKWAIYIAEYDRIFQPFKNHPVRLLEIGIQNGGSLEIWGKFFSNAEKLVGCDINVMCAQLQFDDSRIAVVVKDANTDEAEQIILTHSANFDLIIDDGSHRSEDIIHSFARYFTHLNDGGVYIAEDLHCSYWKDFNGGLFQPYSSISFFKRLADTINHEHWGVEKKRNDILKSFNSNYSLELDELGLSHIHSIEFVNSMCIIKKAPPAENILGNRFISGTQALVDEAPVSLHGSTNQAPRQETNPWSNIEAPLEEDLAILIRENAELSQSSSEYGQEISDLQRNNTEQKKKHFSRLVKLQKNIEKCLVAHAAREESFSLELKELHSAHDQQLHDQRVEQSAREQAYIEQLRLSQEETKNHLQALIDREKAFSQQLLDLQHSNEQEIRAQRLERDAREANYLAQQAKSLEQTENFVLAIAERDRTFAQQLNELHLSHEQEIRAQRLEQNAREASYLAQQAKALQQNENFALAVVERDRTFAKQLDELHSSYEQEMGIQRLEKAACEENVLIQQGKALEQTESFVRTVAEREKLFSQQLRDLHAAHEQQIHEHGKAQAERDQLQEAQLTQAYQQIAIHLQTIAEQEKIFRQQLNDQKISDEQQRNLYFQELIQRKHSSFESILKQKDSEIESILNREEFSLSRFKAEQEVYENKINQAEKEKYQQKIITAQTEKLLNHSNEINREIYSEFKKIPPNSFLFWCNPIKTISRIVEKNLRPEEENKTSFISNSDFNEIKKTANESYSMNHSFTPPTAPAASMADLLALDDDNFVKCAYATFLQREPDALGFSYYTKRIKSGISKVEIVQQIRYGKEGREKQIDIHGMNEVLNRQKFSKIPLIGKVFSSTPSTTHKIFSTGNSNVVCIIPYYNGSAFIERALVSVFQQTLPSDEVIVVDDGSRAEELSFLKELNKKYNFQLISKKNGGQGSARNAGVSASKSKYICFLDQDDFYLPQHNEILVKGIPSDDPNFGWVYADLREADGDGLIVRMSMVKEHSIHPKHSLLDLIRNDMFILPSASLINKKAYQDIGGFDEQFTGYEDDDLFLRLFRKGWSNTFVDKSVTTWCIHGESTSYSVKMSRSRFRYLNKLLQEYPDDPQKARYFFRDLIYPRFESLIVSDAIRAHHAKSKDREELAGYLLKFYELCREAPGFPEEVLAVLKHHVDNICPQN